MEYETKRDPKTGKIKPEERLTPARRHSYLVGAEEECHTAQSRFLALRQNTVDRPTLVQFEEAFSVESVTKEFFREYVRLFDDVLEPLFYDTLATDRGHEAWCKDLGCRIPFLNGGLFEPLAGYDWAKTKITLPNALFTNQTRSESGDVGTGVLNVFDRYNFTVNVAPVAGTCSQ